MIFEEVFLRFCFTNLHYDFAKIVNANSYENRTLISLEIVGLMYRLMAKSCSKSWTCGGARQDKKSCKTSCIVLRLHKSKTSSKTLPLGDTLYSDSVRKIAIINCTRVAAQNSINYRTIYYLCKQCTQQQTANPSITCYFNNNNGGLPSGYLLH